MTQRNTFRVCMNWSPLSINNYPSIQQPRQAGIPRNGEAPLRIECGGVMAELLQVENVSKHFGGVCALKNAHFALGSGEVHALIGENGAGKTTLSRIIAGSALADTANIAIDGRPVTISSPLDAQRLGIGIIYQELD